MTGHFVESIYFKRKGGLPGGPGKREERSKIYSEQISPTADRAPFSPFRTFKSHLFPKALIKIQLHRAF